MSTINYDVRLDTPAIGISAKGAKGNRHAVAGVHRSHIILLAALASGLVLALLVSRLMPQLMYAPLESAYVTADKRSDILLGDGTMVHLDVSSSISVSLGPQRRQVDLLAGRAYFEVAHDAARRPFVVYAGTERITDTGTRFQVERQEQYLLVTLVEGSVSVCAEEDDGVTPPQSLQRGEQMKIRLDDDSWTKRRVNLQQATSWFQDRLVFRATPLAEALEEVNRYSTKKLRLGDADLADLPVSGSYAAGDSDRVTSALSTQLPVLAVDDGEQVMLFHRKNRMSAAQATGRHRETIGRPHDQPYHEIKDAG
jgi:transmembrane sensor